MLGLASEAEERFWWVVGVEGILYSVSVDELWEAAYEFVDT